MTIAAKIIADSIAPNVKRMTTFQLQYPRFIHAEFMTHRMFSRNASSSRAIPVERQIQMIKDDTARPVHWGKNQSGMQAEVETDAPVIFYATERQDGLSWELTAEEAWYEARDRAIEVAENFLKAGYHKQIVNRLLEPYAHITVVCTATNYDNFFALRRHKDAQPEIKVLADRMFEAMQNSTPTNLLENEWHLPYVTQAEKDYVNSPENTLKDDVPLTMDDLIKASVARCARVSYLTHDGQSPSIDKDMALYERLVGSTPLHASPAEHQATPDTRVWSTFDEPMWEHPELHGNLTGGWKQYRKILPNECQNNYGHGV